MIRLRLYLFCWCVAWTAPLAAMDTTNSNFLVRSWWNEDGLPHSTINSIIQTHDGYLWIGTYVGLVRFDGKRFAQFAPQNVPDLDVGQIVYLFEDRNDTLWIGQQNGTLLTYSNGLVHTIIGIEAGSHPVNSMVQQTNGTLWLQTSDGSLARIKDATAEFVSRQQYPDRRCLGLVVDADDQLWVGTATGVKLWRDNQLVSPGVADLEGKPADSLSPARDGSVWVVRDDFLWKVRAGRILEKIKVPDKSVGVTSILETSNGRLWFGSGDGNLFSLEKGGDDWSEIPSAGFQGLNRLLYEDREGNLWRGGFGAGLTRIRPRLFTLHEPDGVFVDKYARSVCSDQQGNIWAVLNDQVLSHIPAGTDQPQAWLNFSYQNPKTLLVDHAGNLWGDASGGRVMRMENGQFVSQLALGPDVNLISAFFEDRDENLWVGYEGGAGAGMLPQGDPTKWHPLTGPLYPDVRTIAQAADGAMWFGTHYGGAFRYAKGQWTQWTKHDGLPSDYVRCLYAEPDGTMWIGTLHGLCRWRDGKLSVITTADGLWNDAISYLTCDNQGNFWIGSFGGIFRVKRVELNNFADGQSKTVQCIGYDRNDGLPSVECVGGFQPAGTKTPDGRLWFPTAGGLVSVNPSQISENRLAPPVWIEDLVVDGRPMDVNHSTIAIQAGPGSRRFDFQFTALSLADSEKNRFRHRLVGLDADWSAPDTQRTATYSYIPPGRYTFQVIACNNDGVWNLAGQSLQLIVAPFYWQTWWFKAAIGLALATSLAWGVRRRERWKARLQFEKLAREHAVERERTRIAKDIHDDLGVNLTRIAFLGRRVAKAIHNPAESEPWVRLISPAANRTIQSLDEIVWAINPKHDSLESLANYLSRFAQEFLKLAGVRCFLEVPTVLPPVSLGAEVRHSLVLTAREALQNIVTHSAATEVHVELRLDGQGLQISIRDNGHGFNPIEAANTGNGLANMQKRLEEIGGKLEIISRAGQGTTIHFRLPNERLKL